jgi:hypothetical protein
MWLKPDRSRTCFISCLKATGIAIISPFVLNTLCVTHQVTDIEDPSGRCPLPARVGGRCSVATLPALSEAEGGATLFHLIPLRPRQARTLHRQDRPTLICLILYTFLGGNTFLEGMSNLFYFGDQVGKLNQLSGGVSTGEN